MLFPSSGETRRVGIMNEKKKRSPNQWIYFGLPEDEKLLSTLGIMSIRHGQLEHVLKMTIKTLGNLSIEEALDATSRDGPAKLRKRIRKLAQGIFREGETLLKLQALLARSERVTEQRNEMTHNLWGHEMDGIPVVRKEDHSWETAPTFEEVNSLSKKIETITKELNDARLQGFIYKEIEKNKKSNQ